MIHGEMKTPWFAVATLSLLLAVHSAIGQPVITSFSQNGVLICSNLAPNSAATVVWSSSPTGPWHSDWSTLTAVAADTNGAVQLSVPMFYRVMQLPGIIPAGAFTMGDTLDSEGNASPIDVYVSQFTMDTNLVSYGQWQAVYNYAMNTGYGFDNAGSGKADNHPVSSVNWYDCVKWCNARSQQAGLMPVYYTDAAWTQLYTSGQVDVVYPKWSADGYRLPTEAEWEKAARGGLSGQRFPSGMTISENQANYNSDGFYNSYDLGPYTGYNTNFDTGATPYTSPVGYFAPNGFGLYDMAGNVTEWCWDWYATPYGQPTTNNPTGPASGIASNGRVIRSGNWGTDAYYSRCAFRQGYNPSFATPYQGFRCVRAH